MKKHQVSLNDFIGYEVTHQMASAFGEGDNKELVLAIVNNEIEYRIFDKTKLSLTTYSLESAIERYNSI